MNVNKFIKTRVLNAYMIKLVCRVGIFLTAFTLYLFDKEQFGEIMTTPIYGWIEPIHILWFIFMCIMMLHIFPLEILTMALRKADEKIYVEQEDYDEVSLLKYVQDQNVKAWMVMLVWLIFNACFGILYLFGFIGEIDLLMLTVFYFLCDYICILFFCPFQTVIMKNKCCVNCRIYDWGHFMMFTPMLFIRDFFSWSLFFTSCVVLIKWEIIYARHPERFWSGSNKNLQCTNCNDKTCQIKKKIIKGLNS